MPCRARRCARSRRPARRTTTTCSARTRSPRTWTATSRPSDDNGGVHINSGIPNHAFYLAATALGGHAWERAGLIWYRTLTSGTPAADRGLRRRSPNATLAAAAAEYGEESEEVDAVRSGWTGVGVLEDDVTDESAERPTVGAGRRSSGDRDAAPAASPACAASGAPSRRPTRRRAGSTLIEGCPWDAVIEASARGRRPVRVARRRALRAAGARAPSSPTARCRVRGATSSTRCGSRRPRRSAGERARRRAAGSSPEAAMSGRSAAEERLALLHRRERLLQVDRAEPAAELEARPGPCARPR